MIAFNGHLLTDGAEHTAGVAAGKGLQAGTNFRHRAAGRIRRLIVRYYHLVDLF